MKKYIFLVVLVFLISPNLSSILGLWEGYSGELDGYPPSLAQFNTVLYYEGMNNCNKSYIEFGKINIMKRGVFVQSREISDCKSLVRKLKYFTNGSNLIISSSRKVLFKGTYRISGNTLIMKKNL